MTLREALDLLTEGDYLKRISRHNAAEFVGAVAVVSAAARAYLALAETGPDYRRAAIEWMGEDPPAEFKGNWDDVIDAAIEQTVKPVVDAALADYLTEEETDGS